MRTSSEPLNDAADGPSPVVLLQAQSGEVAMKNDLFKPGTLNKREEVLKDQEHGGTTRRGLNGT